MDESFRTVLKQCEDHDVNVFVSASAVTDIIYITRKALGNVEDTYRVISNILNIVKVLTVTNDDVVSAFQVKAKDFEDCNLPASHHKIPDCLHLCLLFKYLLI